MCRIFVAESSEFYSKYETQLILDKYQDAEVDELDPSEILDRMKEKKPDVIILDNRMIGCKGSKLIKAIREMAEDLPIVVISSDRRKIDEIKNTKGVTILEKPLKVPKFLAMIGKIYYGK